MTGGASSGRVAALLQLAIVLVISLSMVQGQMVSIGGCQNYQSSSKFNADYVAKLTAETDGYSMLLTSDRPRTSGCQNIIFRSDGTLFIEYQNDYAEMMNFTSNYTVEEATYTEAGYISIEVPGGALGTGLSGNIKLYFIVAEDDHFVVATCEQLLLVPVAIELVHAFVPTSQLGVTISSNLNATLVASGKLERVGSLREVNQACSVSLRGTPSLLQIYNFLVKLGILPPIPFLSDANRQAQFYSGYPTSLQYPNYMYPSSFKAAAQPVQSIAYGQAPVGQPIQAVRQAPANFYNGAPSALPAYPGLSFQSQRPNYVPEVSYKSQQPDITFISGVPYYVQNPKREPFYIPDFDSRQAGSNYMPGVGQFNFQQSGSDQSSDISRDDSAFSSQSSGITYDPSAFNIQSSVVSQDPAVFDSQSTGIVNEPSPFTSQY